MNAQGVKISPVRPTTTAIILPSAVCLEIWSIQSLEGNEDTTAKVGYPFLHLHVGYTGLLMMRLMQ